MFKEKKVRDAQAAGVGHKARSEVEITILFSALVAVAYSLGVYLFGTVAPEMRRSLGFGSDFVGNASAAGQAGLMISALLSGWFAPRLGPVRLILGAAVIITLCLFGIAIATGPYAITLALLVLGLCASAVWIPMVAVAQNAISYENRGKALGVMASGTSFGVFLNGLLVPPVIVRYGWEGVWLAAGVMAATVTAVGLARIRKLDSVGKWGTNDVEIQPSLGISEWGRVPPAAWLLVAMMFLNGLCFLPFQTFLTSFLTEERLLPMETATRSWGIIGAGGMAGGLLFGAMADRISAKWAMVVAYSGLLTATAVFWLANSRLSIFFAAGLFGVAYSGIFGQSAAYLSRTQSGAVATFLTGLTFVALGLGSMVGNFVAGQALRLLADYGVVYGVIVLGVALLSTASLLLPNDNRPSSSPAL